MTRLYLDHAATTPVRPEARQAMAPWYDAHGGNPMSAHAEGRAARAASAEARARVAALVGARPEEVVFTSGATEATNLAVRGGAHVRRLSGKRVAATAIEHAATRRCCDRLAEEGYEVTLLGVDRLGRVDPAEASARLKHGVSVVSVIAGHNEIGTVQPLAELAEAAHAIGALLHLDAVQAAPYLDLTDAPWDMLSLSAHKLGGPQGVGALVCRGDARVSPVLVGGSQEGGLRPGTLPVALVAGFGAAAEAAHAVRPQEALRLARFREALASGLLARWPSAWALGAHAEGQRALPHVVSLAVPGFTGEELVYALDAAGVAASSSSACLSGARSPVLEAIGLSSEASLLRLSLGWTTDDAAIDRAVEAVAIALAALASQSPFDRRRGPFALRAEAAGLALSPAHWEAAEAVFSFHRREGVLPGARQLARALPEAKAIEGLYPKGLSTVAYWLGLPIPAGGCRPFAG